MPLEIDLPKKASDTLVPRARFKVLYGGRDSAKSWSIARMLLARGRAKPERILCTREVQKSIAESVHQLLADQVKVLCLDDFYQVQDHYLYGANGTQISFHGLSGQTATSLKSYEGTTICWVEEAQTVSKRSWDILEPTIRAPDSEIWVSFNPDMDTDATYRRFVLAPPPDSLVTKINWQDNPWRSRVLDAAREKMREEDPDNYAHIYEGHCRAAVEGAIYFKEVSALRSSGRLCNVPYDPMLKVHAIVDLGYDDYMSILLVQRMGSELRVIDYIEDRLRFVPSYSQQLKDMKLNWGKMYLPHDGKAKHVTGRSAQEQFQALEWSVEIVPDIGVEDGIRAARLIFPRTYFDAGKASPLVNRLARYRRRVSQETNAGGAPVHDDQSHGADGFRYFAIVADQLSNDTMKIADPYRGFRRAS